MKEKYALFKMYNKLRKSNLIDCFCKVCSQKMEFLEVVEKLGFPLCFELMGHPSMEKYINQGYIIITF
jgi:hypothetical protein